MFLRRRMSGPREHQQRFLRTFGGPAGFPQLMPGCGRRAMIEDQVAGLVHNDLPLVEAAGIPLVESA